jgi:hypothetical protein
MPQLPRTYLEQPLGRQAGAAQSPGIPAQPRIDTGAVQNAYGSFGAAGGALAKLGLILADTHKELKLASNTALKAQKLGQYIQVLGEEEDAVVNDPEVPALLRDEALQGRMGDRTVQLLDDLEDEALRTELDGTFREQLARRQREIRTKGREDFVKGAVLGITTTVEQLQSQYMQTTDPLGKQQIRQTQTELYSQGEASGIFLPGAAASALAKLDEETRFQEAQALVIAQPFVAEEHFKALAAGEPGIAGLPVPPRDKLPQLYEAAQEEVNDQLTRASAIRASGEKELQAAHDKNRVKLSSAIENARSQRELDALKLQVQAAGADGTATGVSREGYESLTSDIHRMRRVLEEKVQDAKSDPATLEALQQQVTLGRGLRSTAETQMLRNQIVAALDRDGLLWKDARPLLEDLNKEFEADHPVNNPVVQRERAGLIKTMITRTEYEGFSQEEAALQVLALRLFDDAVEAVFQQDYIGGARAAEHKATQIRRELEDQYNETTLGTLLQKLQSEPSQLPPEVLSESSLSPASTPADVDLLFGQAKATVARRYAQGSYTSTEALAYQVQLDKRQAWWKRVARPKPATSSPTKQPSRSLGMDELLLAPPGGR